MLSGLLLGAFGCSSDDDDRYGRRSRLDATSVNVVYDRDIDFSQYLTFGFRDEEDTDPEMLDGLGPAARRDLDLVNERIASELTELGLTQVSADEADLLAFSLARTESGRGVTWSCVGGAWGGYWVWDYYYYDPCAWLEPVYFEIDRTTLMVGLLDPALSEVTFAGFIRGLGVVPGSRYRQIARAVERVFARYPARPSPPGADAGVPGPDASAAGNDAGASDSDAGALPVDAGGVDAGGDAGGGGAP